MSTKIVLDISHTLQVVRKNRPLYTSSETEVVALENGFRIYMYTNKQGTASLYTEF